MNEASPKATSPPRQLGFTIALALVVGNTIGSGIFLLPANLAPFGINSVIAWIVTLPAAALTAALFYYLGFWMK